MEGKQVFDLSRKVTVVTGGGSGIGRRICEAMAECGADVACCDLDKDSAQETVELISKFKRRSVMVQADVSQPDSVQYMVDETIAALGNIDILFNNAGIYPAESKIHETAIEDWDRIMAVDLKGVFLCMRAVLPIMIKRGHGAIINISSINGLRGKFGQTNYSAAKAGVIGFTKAAARELAKYSITVNSVAPGFIETEMSSQYLKISNGSRQKKF